MKSVQLDLRENGSFWPLQEKDKILQFWTNLLFDKLIS